MDITNADVERIYHQHVRVNNNRDYLTRYDPLPLDRNTGRWRWEGKDFPRVICVMEFERLMGEKPVNRLLVVNGGGNDPEADCISPAYTLAVDYDPVTGANDLHTVDLTEKDFDLILLGQTLEHVYDPILALFNLFNHLAPGGCLFASVPTVTFPHSTPQHHYMGFTPTGLGCLCYAAGFDILHIGQWGNAHYIKSMFEMRAWPDYVLLGDQIQNDFNNPAGTWILVQRPA